MKAKDLEFRVVGVRPDPSRRTQKARVQPTNTRKGSPKTIADVVVESRIEANKGTAMTDLERLGRAFRSGAVKGAELHELRHQTPQRTPTRDDVLKAGNGRVTVGAYLKAARELDQR